MRFRLNQKIYGTPRRQLFFAHVQNRPLWLNTGFTVTGHVTSWRDFPWTSEWTLDDPHIRGSVRTTWPSCVRSCQWAVSWSLAWHCRDSVAVPVSCGSQEAGTAAPSATVMPPSRRNCAAGNDRLTTPSPSIAADSSADQMLQGRKTSRRMQWNCCDFCSL